MLQLFYQTFTTLGVPLISRYLQQRLRRGREDAERFQERLGHALVARPQGKLLWCHAASVGESVSLLALIDDIVRRWPGLNLLITTGTVTSARLMANRLPANVIHQYIPVDRMPYVRRFLDHWRPDVALWVESELWPNMLTEMRARKIPAALLNGRMSEKSFRHWQWARGWIGDLLGAFDICLAQSAAEKERFTALGARHVECAGNLKYAAQPLPYDEPALDDLRQHIGKRPVWLMASTHVGEEAIAAEVHRDLQTSYPNLLTVIVPRHAMRGDAIAHALVTSGYHVARRSRHEPITTATQIYLADTMGELGLFYRLCPIVAMGGSFMPVGGHNPIEPAQLGAAIILGPHMGNFATMLDEFITNKAAVQLESVDQLSFMLSKLLADNDLRYAYAHEAQALADDKRQVLQRVSTCLTPWLAPYVGIPAGD